MRRARREPLSRAKASGCCAQAPPHAPRSGAQTTILARSSGRCRGPTCARPARPARRSGAVQISIAADPRTCIFTASGRPRRDEESLQALASKADIRRRLGHGDAFDALTSFVKDYHCPARGDVRCPRNQSSCRRAGLGKRRLVPERAVGVDVIRERLARPDVRHVRFRPSGVPMMPFGCIRSSITRTSFLSAGE